MDLGNITRLMLSQEEEVSQVMKVVHLEIVKIIDNWPDN